MTNKTINSNYQNTKTQTKKMPILNSSHSNSNRNINNQSVRTAGPSNRSHVTRIQSEIIEVFTYCDSEDKNDDNFIHQKA